MTPNIYPDHYTAADIIADVIWTDEGTLRGTVTEAAQALADAGLLMPDLPSVHFTGDGFWGTIWEDCGVTVYRGRRTLELYSAMEHGELPEDLEPDEARQTAYALLAAASYTERNQE